MISPLIEAFGQQEEGYCGICGEPHDDTVRLSLRGWKYEARACAGCLAKWADRARGNGKAEGEDDVR